MIQVKTPDLGGVGNVIEALLDVRRAGVGAFCGGTCNETDVSARVSAHIAMACGASQVLAKPGMGVDEGRDARGQRDDPGRRTGQGPADRVSDRVEKEGKP